MNRILYYRLRSFVCFLEEASSWVIFFIAVSAIGVLFLWIINGSIVFEIPVVERVIKTIVAACVLPLATFILRSATDWLDRDTGK